METEKFELIAKTFQGLEEVLAKELINLGADEVEILRRGVKFKGDIEMMYKANLYCRTALRILKPIYKFEAQDADEVYDKIKLFNWESLMDNSKTFAVDAVVFSDNFKHSKFLAYRVKDAIADYFNQKTGKRPSVRIVNPDVQLNIHIAQDQCTLSIDSSGDILSKRGYREVQTEAPINEALAAGMLLLAGWDGQCDLIDPMCGSGTIVIEAALIAQNIAPGIYRSQGFAFEKWPDFDQELFDRLYNDDSQEREFEHKIYGSDISPRATEIAEANVKRAGVAKCVSLKTSPFQQLTKPAEKAMLVFNPPYGERLAADCELYGMIGSKLKRDYTDMEAWIITPPTEASEKIGLHPSQKFELLNGSIECEFRKYELFSGRRNDFIRDLRERERANEGEENAEEEKVYVRPESYIERGDKEVSEEDESNYRNRRHIAFEKSIHEAAGEYFDKETGEWKKIGERRRRDDSEDRPRRFGDGERRGGFGRRDDDRPRRDFRDHKDFGDRPRRDFGDRERRFDDRPRREGGDGFRREGGFRRDDNRDGGFKKRSFDRRDDNDRPRRDFGDRERRFDDRPRERRDGDRDRRDFGKRDDYNRDRAPRRKFDDDDRRRSED